MSTFRQSKRKQALEQVRQDIDLLCYVAEHDCYEGLSNKEIAKLEGRGRRQKTKLFINLTTQGCQSCCCF